MITEESEKNLKAFKPISSLEKAQLIFGKKFSSMLAI